MGNTGRDRIPRPTDERVKEIARKKNIHLTEEEVADYKLLIEDSLLSLEELKSIEHEEYKPTTSNYTDRSPGYRPGPKEDRYNAWITKCRVEGADQGLLSGKTVGLKDTIALAGYELTAGSNMMEGYIPDIDATIVKRLLDEGATIVGKNNMETFGLSGAGDLSDFGPVLNPRNEKYLAGGSSSGSAAAVAAEECDVAIGGDQAGSIRIPAAWCGVVGLKPTRGLVPYTGIIATNLARDHVGPIARSVSDVAKTMDVIAGPDYDDGLLLDPRQSASDHGKNYYESAKQEVDGITLGILEEGFGWDTSDPEIDKTVENSIRLLEENGAETKPISEPLHRKSGPILAGAIQGAIQLMKEGGVGTSHNGWYWTDYVDAFRKMSATEFNHLPSSVKRSWIVSEYIYEEYNVSFYAKSMNIALELKKRYNNHLDDCDALVLPTTPIPPHELNPGLDRINRLQRARLPLANTSLFNLTGHPAITLPCDTTDDLPVGMMLIGRHYGDDQLLKISQFVEDTI
ncbi:amidase [Natrarchaeobius oligotrophus]|uniref:Amidase n=1 Tax=Natrarchaeobius chitinivorans TaxID=1679083 RepID=A0A3N6N1A7_NATCH|nr:amidase [Natrarchaeobius chitinivorans]RQH01307.1 amidase [Natrarchaeobius chitinivorans]